MNCPKCNGGAYVSEEEAIKILENTTPIKVIVKMTYICRSCNERFSRIFSEDVEAKKRPAEWTAAQQPTAPGMPTSEHAVRPGMSTTGQTQEPADRLKFLDNI